MEHNILNEAFIMYSTSKGLCFNQSKFMIMKQNLLYKAQSTQQHAHAPAEEAELLSKTFKNIKTALNTIHFPFYTKYGFTLR